MYARIYDILSSMLSPNRVLNVYDMMLLQQLSRGVDVYSLNSEQIFELIRGFLSQLGCSNGVQNNTIVINNTGPDFTSIFGETVEISLKNDMGVYTNTILLRNIELLLLPLGIGNNVKGEASVLQKLVQLPIAFILYAVFSVSDFASSLSNENRLEVKNISDLAAAANDNEFILFLTPNLAFMYLESPFEEDKGEPLALKINLVQQEIKGLNPTDRLSLADLVGYIDIMDVMEE